MAFKIEGIIDVTVQEAYVQECRFQPKDNELNARGEYVQCYYDVVLLVHTYSKVKIGQTVYLHIPEDKIRIRKREEVVEIDDQGN